MDRPAPSSADDAARCISCGGRTRTLFPKDGFSIRACADCAFAFALPRPSAEDGFGRFSAYLGARGFDVLPLESDPLCARRIEKRLGTPVVLATFEEWQPRRRDVGAFDLVVMSQVLEHSLDPGAWLAKARALLRHRGVLFVGVPNFASVTTAVLGPREGLICPPVHLNFLCRRSLAHMAAEAGFAMEDWFTWSYVTPSLAGALLARRLRIPRALAAVPGWALTAALRAADALGRGRYLYAFLRPTG